MKTNLSRRAVLALGVSAAAEFCLNSPARAAASPFSFAPKGTTGLELSENGKPIFVYNHGMILADGFPEAMRRSSYLHPVYSPNGALLSDDFNADHPHHRGISWMWPAVVVDGKNGDLWMVKEFRQKFVRWQAQEVGESQARLAVENGWFDGDRQFVKEDVEIIAHPAANDRRLLDFTLRFEALDQPVQIAGTPEGKKGFGGFCFRFAPRDGGTEKTIIRTEAGVAKKDAVLAPHTWAELAGSFQGKPAGARVEDTSANPGYPKNGWLLRHGFGFLNVSYPGLNPITLEPGKPLTLKYRVTLFAGEQM
jgi:hypothetical protein